MGILEQVQQRAMEMLMNWNLCHMQRGRDIWDCSACRLSTRGFQCVQMPNGEDKKAQTQPQEASLKYKKKLVYRECG